MHNSDIDKYINGQLQGEELDAFEQRLKLDPGLQSEVELTRELINDLHRIRWSDKIKRAQRRNRLLKWFKWVLFIILIAASIGYINLIQKAGDPEWNPDAGILTPENEHKHPNPILPADSVNNKSKVPVSDSLPKDEKMPQKEEPILAWQDPVIAKEMADHYFSTPEDFSYVRGSSAESLLDSAKMEFNAEAYNKALTYLQKLTNVSYEKPYFQAICYFRLGKHNDAGELFKLAFNKSTDPQKIMDIEWYSFLNALACGKPCYKDFIRLSQSIQNNEKHLYSRQVKLLLNKTRSSN